jgi:hypothetical protein
VQQGIRWYYCRNTSSRSTIRPLYLFKPKLRIRGIVLVLDGWVLCRKKDPDLRLRPISKTCIRDTHSLHFVRLSDLFLLFR